MKKIVFILLALVLLAPLALYGCANNNNNNNVDNDKYVECKFIARKIDSINPRYYTFKVKVANYTDIEIDIIPSQFSLVENFSDSSSNFDHFSVYEDEALTSKITMSKALAAGQTKELYITTTMNLNSSSLSVDLKYSDQLLAQIRLSNGDIISQNIVRV